MATYNDEGVVLRTHRLGEADRIITVLTRHHGKLRGVAKGVRRTSSKFGARLEPFAQVELQITEARSLDIFTSVVSRHLFGKDFIADYTLYTAAEAMVEVAEKLIPEEGVPALRHYLLLVGALKALAEGTTDGPRPAAMVLDSYILRAASWAGYAPQLDACAICGTPGPHSFFHPASGGMVCLRCRPPASAAVSPVGLAYLKALTTGDWPVTRTAAPARVAEASGLVRAFLNWHVGRGIASLSHIDAGQFEPRHE
ncbi:MAG: DNA repair protein RecO [Propionibacteriaceae bacterium]|jgi:DNA repair protein RecO (recombination protein O)|nr:DNA repair protein RecO [Propionibacteriaceae bacterium]